MIAVPAHRLESAKRIAKALEAAESVAVCTHVGGDGDGWGSASALAHHFLPLGTDVRLLAATPYPDRLRFLLPEGLEPLGPGDRGNEVLRTAAAQVVVDASELGRLGEFAPDFDPARTLVIDHHPVGSSRIEAVESLIDPDATATTELVYDILSQSDAPIGPAAAQALYVGLVTDTGSFRYSNSTPRTHRLAAELIEVGIDIEFVYGPLFGTLTGGELGTLQAALAGLQRDADGRISWISLASSVAEQFGGLDDYERVIDFVRNLVGTEIAVLFRDLGNGLVKISLRSNGAADVSVVAHSLGGGGHRKAAGAEVRGDLSELTRRVLEACRKQLARGEESEG